MDDTQTASMKLWGRIYRELCTLPVERRRIRRDTPQAGYARRGVSPQLAIDDDNDGRGASLGAGLGSALRDAGVGTAGVLSSADAGWETCRTLFKRTGFNDSTSTAQSNLHQIT
jgi:hypothetical protein